VKETYWLSLKLVVLTLTPFVLFYLPIRYVESGPTICIYKNITGHNCYGCGMTRGIISFIQGDFSDSIGYNPLIVFVVPIGMMIYIKELNKTVKKLNFTLFI